MAKLNSIGGGLSSPTSLIWHSCSVMMASPSTLDGNTQQRKGPAPEPLAFVAVIAPSAHQPWWRAQWGGPSAGLFPKVPATVCQHCQCAWFLLSQIGVMGVCWHRGIDAACHMLSQTPHNPLLMQSSSPFLMIKLGMVVTQTL